MLDCAELEYSADLIQALKILDSKAREMGGCIYTPKIIIDYNDPLTVDARAFIEFDWAVLHEYIARLHQQERSNQQE
jgi:hypothetical protein